MAVFTPILGNRRVKMELSKEDREKITRGLGFKGIVTNTLNGRKYKVYGKACGLPGCQCDALAVPYKGK